MARFSANLIFLPTNMRLLTEPETDGMCGAINISLLRSALMKVSSETKISPTSGNRLRSVRSEMFIAKENK